MNWKIGSMVFVMACSLGAQATTVVTNGTEVTITADADYTYPETLNSSVTKVTLAGGQIVTLAACADSFTGDIALTAGSVKLTASTFAGSTASGQTATLTASPSTKIILDTIPQATPVPWKLVVSENTDKTAVKLNGTSARLAVANRMQYNHWHGPMEVTGTLHVTSTGARAWTRPRAMSGLTGL